jgi:hypothetical protein
MRLEADQYESNADAILSKLPPSALIRKAVAGTIRWLIQLSTLSETDQVEAGIFLGSQGRDR